MAQASPTIEHKNAISASWTRCRERHKLSRTATQRILRLQSSEILPRLESILDRTSGCQGIFDQLANSAAATGNCLVVTDDNGIIVRLDSKQTYSGAADWHGISLGSCWGERIAGTNGVSMALAEGRAFTVRGQDHYFSKLSRFTCTATPLLDATNQVIGVLNLASIDHGHAADYLFARQLLEVAADHVQRTLFEDKFRDTKIVSVSIPENRYLFRRNEMIAVDDKGIILGNTSKAHQLTSVSQPVDLKGKSFEQLFNIDMHDLTIPEHAMGLNRNAGQTLIVRTHIPDINHTSGHRGSQNHSVVYPASNSKSVRRRKLTHSLAELAIGSQTMTSICQRSNEYFKRAIPFVIEGASGTGKTALASALHADAKGSSSQVLTVDCATIESGDNDFDYFRYVITQARAIEALALAEEGPSTIVFDNIEELPSYAQAQLRNLLNENEAWCHTSDNAFVTGLRIIATSKQSLKDWVEKNNFRDDLYYLLASTVIRLPKLCEREQRGRLIHSIAKKTAGAEVEITDEAMQALKRYKWPGNIRQLCSVLKQALLDSDGYRITLLNLSETPVIDNIQLEQSAPLPTVVAKTLKYDEPTLLFDALESTRWNVSEAARTLGISRATIHRKMKAHGIHRPK